MANSADIDEWYLSQQPNKFETIDPEIEKFKKEFNLPLMKAFKDYRIRVFKVGNGEIHIKCQDKDGKVNIYYLSKRSKDLEFHAEKGTVYDTLKNIYHSVQGGNLWDFISLLWKK